jgi:LuxR family transcriptional regulator, activator of conjugal transfer of Ti plasmids
MFTNQLAHNRDHDASTVVETSTLFLRPGNANRLDVLTSLKSSRSESHLRDWLLSYARLLGFYGARYIHVGNFWSSQPAISPSHPLRFLTTSPRDVEHANDWLARDPCAVRAVAAFAPFVYSTQAKAVDPLQRIWLENERVRGVSAGVIIPVQDSRDGPAYICLFGNDEQGSHHLAEHYAANLAFVAAHFHAKAKHCVPLADWVPRLSTRELQVLRLAALGNTSAQSGEALNLSAKAVEYHLRNASDKLGAQSKLRAVVLAFVHGLAKF